MVAFNFPTGTCNTVSLSDILEVSPPEKYFLSDKMVERILTSNNSTLQSTPTTASTEQTESVPPSTPCRVGYDSPSSKSPKQPSKDMPSQESETQSTSPSPIVKPDEAVSGGGIAQTLDTGMQQHTLTPEMKIRRLTPTECCRLQGFPDSWVDGISDSQKYKVLGNAVTVNVIRDVVSRMIA